MAGEIYRTVGCGPAAQQRYNIGLLQRFADSGAPTLEDLSEKEGSTPDSEKEGSTPDAIWSDVCSAQGVEPCGVPEFLMPIRA